MKENSKHICEAPFYLAISGVWITPPSPALLLFLQGVKT